MTIFLFYTLDKQGHLLTNSEDKKKTDTYICDKILIFLSKEQKAFKCYLEMDLGNRPTLEPNFSSIY